MQQFKRGFMPSKYFQRAALVMVTLFVVSLAHIVPAADVGQVIDDGTITTEVQSKMMAEKDLPAYKIHVETLNGEVILTGRVDTGADRTRAAEVAQSVAGVKGVDNRIKFHLGPIGANWSC